MKRITFFFLLMALAGMGFAQDYTQYENENLELVRASHDFEYPEIKAPEQEENTGLFGRLKSKNVYAQMERGEPGTVDYQVDRRLLRLMQVHIDENKNRESADGFRVQLFAGSNLGAAQKIKSDFRQVYDEEEVYLEWEQPTFRVRVGDFLTKSEAVVFCNEIRADFPGAFVVTCKVKMQDLRKRTEPDPDELAPQGGSGGPDAPN